MYDKYWYVTHGGLLAGYTIWFLFVAILVKRDLRKAVAPTGPSKTSNTTHIYGIRFFASSVIVACHYLLPGTDRREGFSVRGLGVLLRGGNCTVTLFVTISGFFTHWAYNEALLRSGKFIFYLRRIARIMPIYYFAHFSATLIVWYYDNDFVLINFWGSNLMFATWNTKWASIMPNRMLWTIATLVWCWIMFPPVAYLMVRIRNRSENLKWYGFKMWVFSSLLCQFLAEIPDFYFGPDNTFDEYIQLKVWPPANFMAFVVGACIAEAIMYMPPLSNSKLWPVLCDVTFWSTALLTWYIPYGSTSEYNVCRECFFLNGTMLMCSAFIFLSFQGPVSLWNRFLSHRHFVTLGQYATNIYCLQYPVFTLIRIVNNNWEFAQYERVPTQECVFGYVLLVIASILVNDFYDEPCNLFLRKVCNKIEKKLNSDEGHPEEKVPMISKPAEFGNAMLTTASNGKNLSQVV